MTHRTDFKSTGKLAEVVNKTVNAHPPSTHVRLVQAHVGQISGDFEASASCRPKTTAFERRLAHFPDVARTGAHETAEKASYAIGVLSLSGRVG